MKAILLGGLLLMAGCTNILGDYNIQQSDAGSDTQLKNCWIPNAMYSVTFTKLSGNCPDVAAPSNLWLDDNGHPIFPPNCTDHGYYGACTSYWSDICYTWTYKEELLGELDWSPNGEHASGNLSFTAFEIGNDSLFCSSVYHTEFVKEWEAERDQ